MIELICDKNRAFFRETEKLTSGSIGVTINFVFSPEWDGLLKTAVFDAGEAKIDVVLTSESCEVPPEVLACPGKQLFVGVFGELADKTLVIPTIYAEAGIIRPGASPSGISSAPPTPSWPEQVQAIAIEAKEAADSVRSDAEAGKFAGPAGEAGGFYSPAVTQPDAYTIRLSFSPSKEGMPAVAEKNITLPSGGSGSVAVDSTLTVSGQAADAKATGDAVRSLSEENTALTGRVKKIEESSGIVVVEPMDDDIPKVFLNGDEYGNMTIEKNEVNMEMDYVSKTEQFHSYIKIKFQGSSSLNHPKKNFTIKLYSDELRDNKMKKLFKDWKVENHKYVLKANYIDHSHARNIVCANLWTEVVASRSDYNSLPEELRNSPKNGAIDGFPIKVYVNGVYQGIYTWNIGKDDWMWGMDENNPNHVLLCGETNTNGTFRATPCNFRSLWSGTDGTDWSVEVGTNNSSVKNSLNALISCVKDTDDETFKATIGNYLDVPSAIDYYIHQYIICGYDGLGKNILIGTYDLVKWIFGAYDMDSVLGNAWSGGISIPYDCACPEDYQEQFNLLFERIEKLFLSELKARYSELRKTVYSFSNMYSKFEYFMDLIGHELYAEDLEVYSGIKSDTDIKQIRDYIRNRLTYCDAEFDAMVEPVPCTGITLNSQTLSFTDETAQTLIATVTPSDTTDAILWESNDSSIATVSNGVVTPVANGNCTITVTCGNYSASCSVSVSGLFEPIPCNGVTLSETTLTFTGTGTETLIATVTPSDTTDSLVWSSSDETKATVIDGVVTAIANGSVTITATCGNYSASCSVNISGIETAPLYTLENGIKTFSDGSVLEITNGNHVKLTKASTTASHVNIARVTQNGDDISSAVANRVHEDIYYFKGKIKRVIIDFMDTCTASGNMSLTYSVAFNTGGTYDLASGISIGTDVDKTIASAHERASVISFWTDAGKGVIEFDLKLYNDTERVI